MYHHSGRRVVQNTQPSFNSFSQWVIMNCKISRGFSNSTEAKELKTSNACLMQLFRHIFSTVILETVK